MAEMSFGREEEIQRWGRVAAKVVRVCKREEVVSRIILAGSFFCEVQ